MLLYYHITTLLCYHTTTMKVKSQRKSNWSARELQNYLIITEVFHILFCRKCSVACGRKKVAQKVKEKCYSCVNLACGKRFRSGFLYTELTFLLCYLCTFFASPRRVVFKRYNQPAGCSNREKRSHRGKSRRVVILL